MHEILFIGNIDNTFNKEIIKALKQEFYLQIFNGRKAALDTLIEVSKPHLIFVSLVELTDELKGLLYYIKREYREIAVETLGAKYETISINDLYRSDQFNNIVRPVENPVLFEKCNEAIERGKELLKESIESKHDTDEQGNKNILIVDDNQMVLRNIKSLLDKQYDVSMAVSGSQALMILGKKKVDLILLDYDMPVMDGKQVFKILKANPDCKDIPIIFLTGVSSNEKVFEILSLKPDGYILKPPDADNLLSRIEEIIGR